MRIVSLLPSATELVYALGLGDDLAGVTYECDFPPAAQTLPVVSEAATPYPPSATAAQVDAQVRASMAEQQPLYKLNEGLIAQIQPDVILTQDLCRVCAVPTGQVEEALAKLGCSAEVVSMDPNTIEDVLDSFLVAGKVLGAEDAAEELVAGLRARIAAVQEASRLLPTVGVLTLEWSDPAFIGGHWVPQMVQFSGGTNLLGEPGEKSRTATWKEIADANPEIIVFMPCGYYLEEAEEEGRTLFNNPFFAETPAAQEGAVFAVDATSYFSRPGPRLIDGLEIMAWAVHPETFPEPPPGRISRITR